MKSSPTSCLFVALIILLSCFILVVPVWADEPATESEPPSSEPSEGSETVGAPGVLHYDGSAWTRDEARKVHHLQPRENIVVCH